MGLAGVGVEVSEVSSLLSVTKRRVGTMRMQLIGYDLYESLSAGLAGGGVRVTKCCLF